MCSPQTCRFEWHESAKERQLKSYTITLSRAAADTHTHRKKVPAPVHRQEECGCTWKLKIVHGCAVYDGDIAVE